MYFPLAVKIHRIQKRTTTPQSSEYSILMQTKYFIQKKFPRIFSPNGTKIREAIYPVKNPLALRNLNTIQPISTKAITKTPLLSRDHSLTNRNPRVIITQPSQIAVSAENWD